MSLPELPRQQLRVSVLDAGYAAPHRADDQSTTSSKVAALRRREQAIIGVDRDEEFNRDFSIATNHRSLVSDNGDCAGVVAENEAPYWRVDTGRVAYSGGEAALPDERCNRTWENFKGGLCRVTTPWIVLERITAWRNLGSGQFEAVKPRRGNSGWQAKAHQNTDLG